MLTKVAFFEKDQEALALKKRDCVATLSEVNGSCVITFIEIAIFSLYFFILQLRIINRQRKVKRRNQALMCPPKSGRSYTMKWDHYWQHNTFSMHETSPFFLLHVDRYLVRWKRRMGRKVMWVLTMNPWPFELDSMVMFLTLLNRSSRPRSMILWEWHLSR